jgi:hypothetical protein
VTWLSNEQGGDAALVSGGWRNLEIHSINPLSFQNPTATLTLRCRVYQI